MGAPPRELKNTGDQNETAGSRTAAWRIPSGDPSPPLFGTRLKSLARSGPRCSSLAARSGCALIAIASLCPPPTGGMQGVMGRTWASGPACHGHASERLLLAELRVTAGNGGPPTLAMKNLLRVQISHAPPSAHTYRVHKHISVGHVDLEAGGKRARWTSWSSVQSTREEKVASVAET